MSQAQRNVDTEYYNSHAQYDQAADNFLKGYMTEEFAFEYNGQSILPFTPGLDLKNKTGIFPDTWRDHPEEFVLAYLDTPTYLRDEKFKTQDRMVDGVLFVVGQLGTPGRIASLIVKYDLAVRKGDQAEVQALRQEIIEVVASSSSGYVRPSPTQEGGLGSLDGKSVSNVKAIKAEEANAPFVDKGWNSPYDTSVQVRTFTTTADMGFVRVSTSNNPQGAFLVRADEIRGMNPQRIQQHLALPQIPTQIAEVVVPAGTRMQVGKVAAQPQFGVPNPGGTQYQLLDKIPGSSFGLSKPLK